MVAVAVRVAVAAPAASGPAPASWGNLSACGLSPGHLDPLRTGGIYVLVRAVAEVARSLVGEVPGLAYWAATSAQGPLGHALCCSGGAGSGCLLAVHRLVRQTETVFAPLGLGVARECHVPEGSIHRRPLGAKSGRSHLAEPAVGQQLGHIHILACLYFFH